jgi:hypothetical protein
MCVCTHTHTHTYFTEIRTREFLLCKLKKKKDHITKIYDHDSPSKLVPHFLISL